MNQLLGLGGFRAEHAAALALLRSALHEAQPELEIATGIGAASGELVLLPASLVRPTLLVGFPGGFEVDAVSRDLAASPLGWEGTEETEAWRQLSAPLAAFPRLGRADEARPWLLTGGFQGLAQAEEKAAELRAQVHVVGMGPLDWARHRDVVAWPALPAVVFALLGRAAHVVAAFDYDPLVLDAWRVGVPTSGPCRLEPLLPGLVPPSLLGHAPLWREVAAMALRAREGHPTPALFTPHWIETGRRLSRASSATDKVGSPLRLALRRYAKFRREPERFLADSRLRPLRALGHWWFRD